MVAGVNLGEVERAGSEVRNSVLMIWLLPGQPPEKVCAACGVQVSPEPNTLSLHTPKHLPCMEGPSPLAYPALISPSSRSSSLHTPLIRDHQVRDFSNPGEVSQ